MKHEDLYKYAERYCGLGNTVVGFSVAQTLFFLYALADDKLDLVEQLTPIYGRIVAALVVSGVLAAVAVWVCHLQEAKFYNPKLCTEPSTGEPSAAAFEAAKGASLAAACGRIILLGVWTAVGVAGFLAGVKKI